MRIRRQKFKTLALMLNFAVGIVGCFNGAVGDAKKTSAAPPSPGTKPPAPDGPVPGSITGGALARRLSLDLLNQLPSTADADALTADDSTFLSLVDTYLASAAAHRAIAELHPRMWRLNEMRLPDLDAFAAAADPTLGAGLTDAVRAEIVREPALPIRYMLDNDEPFGALFAHNFTIVHQDVAATWNLTTDGNPWPSEPYVFAHYGDGRPDAGILTTNGLLATYPGEGALARRVRGSRLLHTFGCFRTEEKNAHLFSDLTKDELGMDLSMLAATRAPCVGCHAQFHDQAKTFGDLASGKTFSDWRDFVAPAALSEGTSAGLAFDGLGVEGGNGKPGLATLIGADPRTHRCEVERLAAEIYQRRIGSHDQAPLADALTYFYANGQRLPVSIREILRSPEYRFAAMPATFKADYAQVSSGLKVLKRQQWQTVLAQLSPSTAALSVPPELDPGINEAVTDTDRVPAGAYWHYADRLARQAAQIIVDAELKDGVTAATRRVFTTLPDGDGKAATTTIVNAQIKDLWKLMTTNELADKDDAFVGFTQLWAAAPPDGTADDFKRAWRMILIAMLTHPEFITY